MLALNRDFVQVPTYPIPRETFCTTMEVDTLMTIASTFRRHDSWWVSWPRTRDPLGQSRYSVLPRHCVSTPANKIPSQRACIDKFSGRETLPYCDVVLVIALSLLMIFTIYEDTVAHIMEAQGQCRQTWPPYL